MASTKNNKKKVQSTKKKNNMKISFNFNILKYCLLGVFVIFAVVLLVSYVTKDKAVFKVENRVNSILEAQKTDGANYKTYAWLRIPGTNIDHKIIRFVDDYVNDGYPVSDEKFGWGFHDDYKYHNKMNISGHNILNLSSNPSMHDKSFNRFEDLMSYVYYDFAKDNQFIQLTIDGKDYVYQIFAVTFMSVYDANNFNTLDATEEELKDYIDYVTKYSLFDYDIKVNEKDNIISVTTCTRFLGEDSNDVFVVSGKLLDNDEYELINVEKSKNYSRFENIMKGSEENE